MVSAQFKRHADSVAESIEVEGLSVVDAARRHGVAARTVERWIARGRSEPDGPYGGFATRIARARAERTATPQAGAVLEAVAGYVATLGELDAHNGIQAALAASLAQAVDGAQRLGSAAALAAIPRLVSELGDVLLLLSRGDSEPERLRRMMAPLIERNR